MEEKIISFKTATLAKKKGFDGIQVYAVWMNSKYLDINPEYSPDYKYQDDIKSMFGAKCLAPTQSLLQKWLREVHNTHIEIFLDDNSPYEEFYYRVMTIGEYFVTSHDGILSKEYEEALEKGLEEALKLLE